MAAVGFRVWKRSLAAIGVCAPLLGVFAGALVALVPSMVEAQTRVPRIAVGPFEGERPAVTRGMVGSVFADHVGEIELVSATEFNGATERAGLGGRTDPESMAQIARGLRLDQVVVGTLDRRGRGYRLQLRVLRGRDGQTAGSAAWEFDRIEEVSALSTEIWDQLQSYLRPEGATGNGIVRPRQPPVVIETPTQPDPPSSNGNGGPAMGARPMEGAIVPGDLTPGLGYLALRAGGGVAGRSWRVPVLGERTPRGYENSLYGDLQAAITLRYVFARRRYGIGLDAQIAVPVGLSSQGRGADGQVTTLSTSALQTLIGLQFAHRPWTGGAFFLSAGLSYQTFSLDTRALATEMQIASATYIGLRVAGEGQFPFVVHRGIEFDGIFGGELRVVGIGTELKKAFGANPGTTLGFGAWFGLGLRLDRAVPGLGLRGTVEWVRYRTGFAGPASVGTGSDAVDDYSRFLFSLTYEFGTEPAAPAVRARGAGNGGGAVRAREGGNTGGDPFGGR